MPDWTSLIKPGLQIGANVLGTKLNNRPTEQQNAWSRQQYEQQLARRNAMLGLAMPSMLRAMGNSNPQRAISQAGLGQGQSPGMASGGNAVQGPTQGSTKLQKAGQIGGLAATGLGIASKLGVLGGSSLVPAGGAFATGTAGGGLGATMAGLATNPITIAGAGVLGAGLIAKHYIGQGRKAANNFVQDVENPFNEQLKQFSAGQGSPEEFQRAYQNYQQRAQEEIAKGGNKAKVAQQSLQNQGLQQTIQRLAQQFQVPIGGA